MNVLGALLPWIGAATTGGVPALLGMAAKTIGGALGYEVKPDKGAIEEAVNGATPDELLALRQADNEFKVKMQSMGFEHEEDLAKLRLDEVRVFVADTSDARHTFATNQRVFWMGVAIILSFAAVAGISMWG